MAAELKEQENQLRAAGFGETEIQGWLTEKAHDLRQAGFSGEEIDQAMGIPKPPDFTKFRQELQEKFAKKPVSGVADALKAGFGMSVSSLAVRNPEHDNVLTQDADMAERLAYSVGQMTGDVPWMVVGAALGGGTGAAAGAAAGTAAEPGAGTIAGGAIGGVVGAGAGAFALPAGLRATLMDSYEHGNFESVRDFLSRASGIIWETAKGAIVGATTAGAGAATKAILPEVTSAATKMLAPTAAELATMVTTSKALEGEIPSPQDFLDGAILFAGFKGSMKVVGKLRDTYKLSALKPDEVATAAQADVTVRQDIADENTIVPRALEVIAKQRGGEVDERSTEDVKSVGEALAIVAKEEEKPGTDVSTEVKPEKVGQTYEHGDEGTSVPPEMEAGAAEKQIKEQMAKRPEPQSEKITWDKLYTELKDKLHPIKLLVDRINGELGRKLPPERDPYILMRLLAGNSGKFKQVVENNVYDTDTLKNLGPGLEKRLDPVKGDLEKFQTYMLAKRALERIGKGFDVGISKDAASAVVKEFEEKENGAYLGGEKSKFQKAFESINEYQEIVGRQFLVKSGIMSEAQFRTILDHSRDFVPLHRIYEELQTGKSEAFVWNPIKEFKGSNAKIIRPIESILRNTYLYIALGEKNRAGLALVEGVEAVNRFKAGRSFVNDVLKPGMEEIPEVKRLLDALPNKQTNLVLHGAPGERPLLEQVPNEKDLPTPLKAIGKRFGDEFAQTLRPLFEAINLGEGDQISVFRNGERITLKAAPEVAEVFHGLDSQSMNALMKIFSAPAAMLRAGVALLPEYAARNLIIDQPMAGILSKNGYIPFLSALRSITHVFAKDELYQRWLKSGGANVALVSMDSRYIESKFAQWGSETGWYNRVWNSVKLNYKEGGAFKGTLGTVGDTAYALFAPLRILSQMSDTLTRLGEMRNADREDSRRSAIAAGYDTREVTQDFLRMGSMTKGFNAITAFANSQFEGVDRVVRSFAERPAATLFKTMGMIMMPSLMLWVANRDEKWYRDLPDYIRDNYWAFKVKDHIWKVRKPFEVGVIFGSGLERSLDAMFTDNDEAFRGFANTVYQNIMPNLMPTIAQPVIEQITNHSFFNDRPLIPSSMERLLPEYQYTPYTSQTSKAIGSAIGFVPNLKTGSLEHLSPIVVDNYIREWSGGMGQYLLQVADAAMIKAGVIPDPIKPASTLEDTPIIKAFMVRYPNSNTKSIQDFYEHYDNAVKIVTTARVLASRGNAEAAVRLMTIQEDIVKLEGVHTSLANANHLIQTVNALPDIQPQEKRQLLETIYFNMTEIGREGAAAVHRVNKALKGGAK